MLMARNICVILKKVLGGCGCDILSSWCRPSTALGACCCYLPPPPLVALSAALVIVVDSIVSWRGWWHCHRIAPPPNNNDRDLSFPLFLFQKRGGGQAGGGDQEQRMTRHKKLPGHAIFSTCLNDKKNSQKDKWDRHPDPLLLKLPRPHKGCFLHIRLWPNTYYLWRYTWSKLGNFA